MLTFRNLALSIAGLLALCFVQNQTHPHKYVDYSPHCSTDQTLRASLIKTTVDTGIIHHGASAPDHDATVDAALPRLIVQQSFYSPVSCAECQPKLYRIFPTGLSPPSHSSLFS